MILGRFFVLIFERSGKNFGMDYILLVIALFYFFRGFFKGFVSMLFSLLGTIFVIVLSWTLCDVLMPTIQNWIGEDVQNFVSNALNSAIPGEFENWSKLSETITQSRFGIVLSFLIEKLVGDISFEGTLTAGQILGASLSNVLLKVITFVLLFLILFLILKILRLVLNSIIKSFGLTFVNRFFGGVIGLAKGLVVFGVLFFVLTTFASLFLNESLMNFVEGGVVSNFLYENIILKFVEMLY